MDNIPTEDDVRLAAEKRQAMFEALNIVYLERLDDSMGRLHNQFVAFIASAGLPLPQVLLVLEMLVRETVEQAAAQYLGE